MKIKRYIPFILLCVIFIISLLMLFNGDEYKNDSMSVDNNELNNDSMLSQDEVDLIKPPVPPSKIIIEEHINKIKLSWEAIQNVSAYEIKINDEAIVNTSTHEYIHDGIKPGDQYTYKIRSIDKYGIGKWSESVSGIPKKPDKFILNEKIEMDGSIIDWEGIDPLYSNEQIGITVVYDKNNMYLLVQGEQIQDGNCFYVDCDSNENTGYIQTGWIGTGVEFMVCDSTLYQYKGKGSDWLWDNVAEIDYFIGDTMAEFIIPLHSIGITDIGDIRMGYSLGEDIHIPQKSKEMFFVSQEILYDLSAIKPPALLGTEISASKIIVKYEGVDKAEGYEIEVDNQIINLGKDSFYRHTGLEPGSNHTYRIRAKSSERNSLWSKKRVLQTKSMDPLPGKIKVDGKVNDWTYLYNELANDKLPSGIYAAWSNNALGLLVVNPNMGNEDIIFIDSGNENSVGYKALPWNYPKADYLIDGETISRYIGNGSDWKWSPMGEVSVVKTKDILEVKIDISLFDFKQPREIGLGFMVDDNNCIPAEGKDMISGYKVLTDTAQQLYSPQRVELFSGSRNIDIKWEPVYGAQNYEIEVNGKIIGTSQNNEYKHIGLVPNTTYSYRIRAINDDVVSSWSKPLTRKTLADNVKINVDGRHEDWNELMLSAHDDKNNIKLYTLQDKKGLYFLIQGEGVSGESNIYIDVDGRSTGYNVLDWYQSGADYLLYESYISRYIGNGENWSWKDIGEANIISNSNMIEGYLDFQLLDNNNMNELKIGFVNNDIIYLPSATQAMIKTNHVGAVYQDLIIPSSIVVQPTIDHISLEWEGVKGATSYEIEINNKIIQVDLTRYKDMDVQIGKEYTYRIRSKNSYTTSGWSEKVTKTLIASEPHIKLDGIVTDWIGIEPVADNEIFSLYAYIDKYYLNIMVQEKDGSKENYIYIDVDNDNKTGYKNSNWSDCGVDYVVINGYLHKYIGDGDNWSFEYIREITGIKKDNVYEIKLAKSYIGMKNTTIIKLGYSDNVDKNIPKEGSGMVVVNKWE
ncbi:hypothetical protein AN1V17_44290 [Vallitalea sediminicola]